MTDEERERRHVLERRAVELWRMGFGADDVAKQTGLSKRRVLTLARRTLDSALEGSTDDIRRSVLDQLNRLQQVAWPAAVKGDLKAMEQVQSLLRDRMRIAQMIDRDSMQTPMGDAYEATIAALSPAVADSALVQAGRRIAARIDSAALALDPATETKALYLVPQLVNVLRELGATPASRDAVIAAAPSEKDDLAAFRDRHGVA